MDAVLAAAAHTVINIFDSVGGEMSECKIPQDCVFDIAQPFVKKARFSANTQETVMMPSPERFGAESVGY